MKNVSSRMFKSVGAVALALSMAACGATATASSAVSASSTADTASSTADAASTADATAGAAAANDPKVELVFTSVSVTGDSHTDAMKTFADKVEELSGGSVTCKIYSDGTLFSSENELDAVLQGSAAGGADIAYISFPTLATQPGLEWCSMINSAYFWSSEEHMSKTLNESDIGKEIFSKISENTNLTPLGAFYLGVRCVNTVNKEINSYDDMSGLLLRMPNSEAWLDLGTALGANPTPLSFSELYTALQTGTVDGQENPLPTDVSAKFYEVTKYLAMTNHVVDSILPCMSTTTWNSLTPAQQEAVQGAMDAARDTNDTERLDAESKDVQILKDNGVTITEPDVAEFKAKAQDYYENTSKLTASWDWDLYKRIQDAA